MKTMKTLLPVLLTLTALSACGRGGTDGNSFNDTLSLDANSTAPANVTAFLTTPSADGITATAGTYNRADDTFEVAGLTGSLDAKTGEISLDGGGTGLASTDREFSGTVLLQSAAGTEFGVYGIPASSLPVSGTANYAGQSNVVINDGVAVYDLAGTSSINVDFAGSRLNTSMDNLDGTRTDAAGVADVTDVAQLDLTFVTIADDGTFEGGSVDLFSDTLGTFESGQEVLEHQGALFGPNAAEVGGVFTIDDTEVGSLLIHGVYSAD